MERTWKNFFRLEDRFEVDTESESCEMYPGPIELVEINHSISIK